MRWGPLVEGSICDEDLLKRTRLAHGIEAVIHTAALSNVAQSVRDPGLYATVNFVGTELVNDIFWDLPIIFSSSAAVYGSSDKALSEGDRKCPINPYGKSKLDAEMALNNATSLRYFNVSGCDPEIGTGHKPQTHLIPRVLQAAMHGSVFEVHGDGGSIRDFVDVRDVARANVMALKSFAPGPVNICGGVGYSVTEVIRTATKVTGRKIRTMLGPAREGDPDKVVGRNYLAYDVLGWKPAYSLHDQVAACWDWMNQKIAA